jgi:chromate transporter
VATPRITLLDLAATFAQIGFSSIGGAAAPLRHGIVVRRRWLDENEFSETFGVCQALPGATGGNVAIVIGQRFGGWLGSLVALGAFTIPTMILAIGLGALAIRLASSDLRFEHAEAAIAAGAAGLFASNGIRVGASLWRIEKRGSARLQRVAISALGVVLVAGFHLWVPAAVVILVALSLIVERRRAAR